MAGNQTITVLEADGVTQTDVEVLGMGRQAAAASKSVELCTEDKAVLDAIAASLSVIDDWDSTDRVNITAASGSIASGAIASGAVVSGAVAAGTASFVKLQDAAYAVGGTHAVLGLGAVRDDALSTLAEAESDWGPLFRTSTGALWVQDASLNNNGQATMSASSPVVIASDQTPVATGPSTTGGLAIHRSIDLDEGALEVVKASPGQLYSMWVSNLATTTRFVKFYNATSGTIGTGTPVITIAVPGNSADDVTGHLTGGGHGIAFSTGICVGASTGVADADTGAPGANEVIANIFYK